MSPTEAAARYAKLVQGGMSPEEAQRKVAAEMAGQPVDPPPAGPQPAAAPPTRAAGQESSATGLTPIQQANYFSRLLELGMDEESALAYINNLNSQAESQPQTLAARPATAQAAYAAGQDPQSVALNQTRAQRDYAQKQMASAQQYADQVAQQQQEARDRHAQSLKAERTNTWGPAGQVGAVQSRLLAESAIANKGQALDQARQQADLATQKYNAANSQYSQMTTPKASSLMNQAVTNYSQAKQKKAPFSAPGGQTATTKPAQTATVTNTTPEVVKPTNPQQAPVKKKTTNISY